MKKLLYLLVISSDYVAQFTKPWYRCVGIAYVTTKQTLWQQHELR